MSLIGEKYISLATFRKNGQAVETPVWFAQQDDNIFIFSSGDAGKVKRLKNSSRARIAPCTVSGVIKGEWKEATAHIIESAQEQDLAYRALLNKYRFQMRFLDFFSSLFRKKESRVFIVLQLN
jgi:hypothetical protein